VLTHLVDLEKALFERADRDDEPAPGLELLDQSLRDGWRAGIIVRAEN